jgi:DNA-binding protein HU-beta
MALPMMTQAELIEALSDLTGFQKGEIRHVLSAVDEVVAEQMKNGERIKIAGVVIAPTLKKATKKRKGRNPQTGEEVMIAAKPASVRIKAKVVSPLSKAKVPSARALQNRL